MRVSRVVTQRRVLTPFLGYPAANLADTDENKAPVRKGDTKTKGGIAPHKQKGAKVTGAKGEDDSDIEAGSNSSESSKSDPSNQTSGSDDSSFSEVALQSASDLEPVPEKKVPSARKPSKKTIETALNEVSRVSNTSQSGATHFPTTKLPIFKDSPEHESDPQNSRRIAVPDVKVKVENIDTDSDNGDDEDEDQDEEDNDRNDEKGQAMRVYHRALKVLRFRLYFNTGFSYFFPMGHGPCGMTKCPWVMGHAMLYRTPYALCTTHDPWK